MMKRWSTADKLAAAWLAALIALVWVLALTGHA